MTNEIILAGIKKQVRIGKLFHARSLLTSAIIIEPFNQSDIFNRPNGLSLTSEVNSWNDKTGILAIFEEK